jgi:hypothetical protein
MNPTSPPYGQNYDASLKAGSTYQKKAAEISSGSAAPSCTSDAVRPRIPPTRKVKQIKEESTSLNFALAFPKRRFCGARSYAGIVTLRRESSNAPSAVEVLQLQL